MRIDLTGRTALVTGASEGLGRAVAARLSASGANVVLCARRQGPLDEAAAALREDARGGVLAVPCDVTDGAARDAAVAAALAEFGAVDILVNNAGSSARRGIADLDGALAAADFALKVLAPIALVRAVLPGMKERRWGRILNVTSIGGKVADAGSMPTSVSRAAGITMTKALSRELAPFGILVNALCVGKIRSGQWERRHAAANDGQSFDEFLKPIDESVPLGRMGRAEEFANVACFLASDAASYVTGTAINVDGGLCPVP